MAILSSCRASGPVERDVGRPGNDSQVRVSATVMDGGFLTQTLINRFRRLPARWEKSPVAVIVTLAWAVSGFRSRMQPVCGAS